MKPHIKDGFLKAYQIASLSIDPSTQVGAVLVTDEDSPTILSGNNHPTHGISIHEADSFGGKGSFMEHAESTVLLKAARLGLRTDGAVMYAPWSACTECARAIVTAGVSVLYRHKEAMDRTPERWIKSTEVGTIIMQRAGVEVHEEEGRVGGVPVLFCGEVWHP